LRGGKFRKVGNEEAGKENLKIKKIENVYSRSFLKILSESDL
jgi:hypothetical protein